MNATAMRLARISQRDRYQAQELPLGSLHRLLCAANPALGLVTLRVLRDWEQGRVCLDVCVASKQCKAGQWAKMGHVGYTWAEDEGVWVGMVRGDWEGGREVELKEQRPPHPQGQTTTPRTHGHQNRRQENPQKAF